MKLLKLKYFFFVCDEVKKPCSVNYRVQEFDEKLQEWVTLHGQGGSVKIVKNKKK